MSRTILHNCRVLAGHDSDVTAPRDVVVEGNRIAAITAPGPTSGPGAIDASGCLLTAGMINGHFHSHEHFQKGRFDNLPLELWMNYVRPPRPVPVTARQVYLRT